MSASSDATSSTLLARLRQAPDDPVAWAAFVGRYGPKVYGWCRRWSLQPADAEDVTQDVLLKLAAKLRAFAYDRSGSFRAWLKTLAHHAWQDFIEGRRRAGVGHGGSESLQALQEAEAREDLLARLEQEYDCEMLEVAMARVRLRLQPHTWEAFRLQALDGLSGAEAAGRLGIKVATAFVARSKVQKMIQEELRRLDGAEGVP
jgi:RNA polymerase sigma-70 factor (ECF subfamily)